ncbi:MAG TPA: VOC family protein [Acidimicrobiales bacterium]
MADRLVQAIVLVTDLASARRRTEALGLTVLDGGRHPGRGTANLIVPLGTQYLELLAVVDEGEARSSPQGRPVLAALARRGPGVARWSMEVTPGDIDATAARVGLPVEHRQRILGDGTTVRWRCVAVDASWEAPWRCAFMVWDDAQLHPARLGDVVHRCGATGFARLELHVPDPVALSGWLGADPPQGVDVRVGGDTGPTALLLASPSGEIRVA